MASDPTRRSHQECLGYIQPVGVVVSTPALLKALLSTAISSRSIAISSPCFRLIATAFPSLNTEVSAFATNILGWKPTDLKNPPESFTISIIGYEDILSPTYVVTGGDATILLVQELTLEKTAEELDLEITIDAHRWKASPQMRFERLLRETGACRTAYRSSVHRAIASPFAAPPFLRCHTIRIRKS
jgi:hypothetical protein